MSKSVVGVIETAPPLNVEQQGGSGLTSGALVSLVRGAVLMWIVVLAGILSPATVLSVQASSRAVPGIDPNFYKLTVSQSGMQAVTYATLETAGLPVSTLDPTTFQLYEQGTQIARQVVDADNSGTFNSGDYILFYGRAVNTDFTSTNVYWLTYGVAAGLDMTTRDGTPQPGLPPVTTFLETLHFEQNKLWKSDAPLTGVADHWYWQTLQPTCDHYGNCVPGVLAYSLQVSGVATGTYTTTLTPRLRGDSLRSHVVDLYINSQGVGQATFDRRDEFLGSLDFSQGVLIEGTNTLTITSPVDGQSVQDASLVNWFELSYHRTYTAPVNSQFAFAVDATEPSAVTLTDVQDGSTAVYDISDPQHPVELTGIETSATAAALRPDAGFSVTFAHHLSTSAQYIAAGPSQYLSPGSITLDTPSNLHNPTEGADWIIISHHDFLSAAETLAAHRRTWQGLRTAVVDVQDIYDEFNGGLMDQEAIRNFIRYAYEHWPSPAPQYVVLLGDGHYDPQNFLGTNSPTYIPPYLAAVDPFEGLTAADNRYAAYDPVPPAINPVSFMHIGRLPADTLTDAQAMVNKIVSYETAPTDLSWQRQTVFVADNPDYAGDFQANSNAVADNPAYLPIEYNRQKIYYVANSNPGDTTDAIVNAINTGALLVNYNGHASWRSWASEGIWQTSHLSRLTNAGKYPMMITMACLEGYFIVPYSTLQSLGESIVRLPNAGAVASWSPAGKGVAAGHDVLFQGFYDAVFGQGIGQIGPAVTYAKQTLYDSSSAYKDLIDTYTLFGDPAMPLKLAAPDVWAQKTSQPAGPWYAGEQVSYILNYGNSGSAPAASVVLTDVLPVAIVNPSWSASDPAVTPISGQTYAWQLPDLSPDATGTITLTATVDPAMADGVTISNVVTITTAAWESPQQKTNNTSQVEDSTVLPTVLYLESFQGWRTENGVDLEWATRLEDNMLGFNIYRTVIPTEHGKLITPDLIPASAPPGDGAQYAWRDLGILASQSVYYWLEIVDLNSSGWFGPVAPMWASVVRLPFVIH